jgi:multidrug efflux system membrane fusion protein
VATQKALVDQDEGVVKVDKGNLASANINLAYTRIVSPIDGQAGLRLVDQGNIVAANGTAGLVTIAQLEPITVIFTLAEDHIPEVEAQTTAGKTLRVDAMDRDQKHTLAQGTLITLDVQINPTTGTVRARAIFPNLEHELFPNQFVNARLYTKTLTDVNLAPTAAIQLNGDTSFVYVVQADGTVKSTNVTIAASEGEVAAVTGVNAGDKLVTDGFDKLQSGVKVTVRTPKAAAKPANPANPADPATPATTTDSATAPTPATPATPTTKP